MSRQFLTRVHAAPVAEGVRFKIGSATAFAVRRDNQDVALRIRRERRPLRSLMERTPFVRGMHRLLTATRDLIDGISESAELEPQRTMGPFVGALAGLGSAIMILLLAVGLIWMLPMAVSDYALPRLTLTRAQANAIVCAVRCLGTLLALDLTAHLPLIRRLCMYRGAINKVLNAYEARPRHMSHDRAARASAVFHRSDAAFLTVVALLSIVAFALIRTFTLPVQVLVRLLVILAVAAVVNEPIQALEALPAKRKLAALLKPYLWLSRMFVAEPEDQMVETAVYAFNAARENDER